jgi:hypothetical protein
MAEAGRHRLLQLPCGADKRTDTDRVPLPRPPEVGAVCPNWARTDLCGGREVTRVPTAIGRQPRPTLPEVTRCMVRPDTDARFTARS